MPQAASSPHMLLDSSHLQHDPSAATLLLAGLKSPADEALGEVMYLLGGPLVWGLSLAFILGVILSKEEFGPN